MLNFQTQPPSSHFLFRKDFTKCSDRYKELGQFAYDQPHCTKYHIATCIKEFYEKYIYFGEVKEGTADIPHGIGIKVDSRRGIAEGYWKDGKLHGRGRHIYNFGSYYIGEWKKGYRDGEWIEYNGNSKYEGEWKDDSKHGQGTYYKRNGDKYTGQWDDKKGQGEINYEDGTKYIGEWYDTQRDGLGTLYSADGQVLNQGKWYEDKYMGKE